MSEGLCGKRPGPCRFEGGWARPLTGAALGPEPWLRRGSPVTGRCWLCLPSPAPGTPGCSRLFPSGLRAGRGQARPRPCRRPLSPAAERCRGEGTGKGTGCKLCTKRLRNVHGLGSRSAGPCFKAKIGCQFSAGASDNISPAGVTAHPSALGEGGELGTLFPTCLRAPLRASCS